MLEFGNLQVVEKTFNRTAGATRKQSYTGIKFRRTNSNKAGVQAVDEYFVVSNHLFAQLGLETNALTQAEKDGKVYVLVLEDQDEVAPVAKFMRQSIKKDGSKQKKGKMINNDILKDALITAGVLNPTQMGSQFLNLAKVEAAGLPAHVHGVYEVVVDTTISAEDAAAEDAEADSTTETEF